MSTIHVRRATLEDLPAICHVHVTTAQDTYRSMLPQHSLLRFTVDHRPDQLEKYIEHDGISYVAEMDNAIVGFLSIGEHRGNQNDIKSEIYKLYVLPHYQRRKIGTAMFREAAAWVKSKKLMPLGLWGFSSTPAHYFYQAMGGIILAQRMEMLGDLSFTELLFMFS